MVSGSKPFAPLANEIAWSRSSMVSDSSALRRAALTFDSNSASLWAEFYFFQFFCSPKKICESKYRFHCFRSTQKTCTVSRRREHRSCSDVCVWNSTVVCATYLSLGPSSSALIRMASLYHLELPTSKPAVPTRQHRRETAQSGVCAPHVNRHTSPNKCVFWHLFPQRSR